MVTWAMSAGFSSTMRTGDPLSDRDTRNWWLGHQVLIAPEWIQGVSWDKHTVSVRLTGMR